MCFWHTCVLIAVCVLQVRVIISIWNSKSGRDVLLTGILFSLFAIVTSFYFAKQMAYGDWTPVISCSFLDILAVLTTCFLAVFVQSKTTGDGKFAWMSLTTGIAGMLFIYIASASWLFHILEGWHMPMKAGQLVMLIAKSGLRGMHFAVNAMTAGLYGEADSGAYSLLRFLSAEGPLLWPHWLLEGVAIAIAPFSTVTIFASFLNANMGPRIRMFGSFRNSKVFFYDASPESVYIAGALRGNFPKICTVFCRVDKSSQDISAEVRSEILRIRGICLPDTEVELPFDQESICIICTESLVTVHSYLKYIRPGEQEIGKVIVLANESKEQIEMIAKASGFVKDLEGNASGVPSALSVYSRWETIAQLMERDMAEQDCEQALFLAGSGSTFLTVAMYFLRNEGREVVLFPDSLRDYRRIEVEMNDREHQRFSMVEPNSDREGDLEKRLFKYMYNYEPKKKRYIVFISENTEDAFDRKRLVCKGFEESVKRGEINVFVYCEDVIAIEEKKAYDSHFFGLSQMGEGEEEGETEGGDIGRKDPCRYFGDRKSILKELLTERNPSEDPGMLDEMKLFLSSNQKM